MAAPVQPETQENVQPQGSPTEPTESGAQGSQTTSTPNDQPPQDNRLLDLYQQNLREQHQRIIQLESENRDYRTRAEAPPVQPPQRPTEAQEQELWQRPVSTIRDIIREETM